jgi:hypothetical protein
VKGIQVYSNKEPGPLLRGDTHKNVKKKKKKKKMVGSFKNLL